MNFTREPVIETVITPNEGNKLVVRNSKGSGQEEFFVDAVEVISFGNSCFFRAMERPKCFLVPVSDYEVLEVREAKIFLKTQPIEKGIKIGGGRETSLKQPAREKEVEEIAAEGQEMATSGESKEPKEKRDRRKRFRKKKEAEGELEVQQRIEGVEVSHEAIIEKRPERPTLIPPPTTLITESIARYKSMLPQEEVPSIKEVEEEVPPFFIKEEEPLE